MDIKTADQEIYDIDLKTVKLGHSFDHSELFNYFKTIWAAVSWPGKNPGCAVVVAMGHKKHLDGYDVFLIDEFESFDMRKLIRQCKVLDFKYHITSDDYQRADSLGCFIGDYKNETANQFIDEINEEKEYGATKAKWQFSLNPTLILEMERPYQYIMPQIKEQLSPKKLYLKNGKTTDYLIEIETREREISEMQIGEFPAIEALAFAAIEMRNSVRLHEKTAHLPKCGDPWGGNVLTRGLKSFERRRRT